MIDHCGLNLAQGRASEWLLISKVDRHGRPSFDQLTPYRFSKGALHLKTKSMTFGVVKRRRSRAGMKAQRMTC